MYKAYWQKHIRKLFTRQVIKKKKGQEESPADKAYRVQRDGVSINMIECLKVPQKGEGCEWHLV